MKKIDNINYIFNKKISEINNKNKFTLDAHKKDNPISNKSITKLAINDEVKNEATNEIDKVILEKLSKLNSNLSFSLKHLRTNSSNPNKDNIVSASRLINDCQGIVYSLNELITKLL